MKSTALSFDAMQIVPSILGVLLAVYVLAYLAGRPIPFVTNDRAAFIALAAAGFVMCSIGMGRVATGLGWTHPITLTGIVLGVAILALAGAMLVGFKVPFVRDYRAAFIAVAVMGLAKWALAMAGAFLRRA